MKGGIKAVYYSLLDPVCLLCTTDLPGKHTHKKHTEVMFTDWILCLMNSGFI